MKQWATVGIAFLIGCLVLVLISYEARIPVATLAEPALPALPELPPDAVMLSNGNTEPVFLATTEEGVDQLTAAQAAGDSDGIAELIKADKVFVVPAETPATVIEERGDRARVRICGRVGHTNLTGWLPKAQVQK